MYNTGSTTCNYNTPCYSYYTYTVATVNSNTSSNNVGVSASYDICPKGWRLPTKSEYDSLVNYHINNSSLLSNSAFKLAYSGQYTSSNNFVSGGAWGKLWSSTAATANSSWGIIYTAYALNSASSNISITNYHKTTNENVFYGEGVRCVLK